MKPTLVVLAGPTASGKSALALDLAERVGAEIVSADSQQVYRGLDIGTAKPTAAERARVPHHLVDVADPGEQLTAADFVRLADEAVADVTARGRKVLVVGGTGLWIRALLRGLAAAPPRDEGIRERLEALADAEGTPALHARLAKVDPEAASRLHENDRVRLVRALEVHELTGRPISAIQAEHAFRASRYPHAIFALDVPREVLRARIRERIGRMIDRGWPEEARRVEAASGGAHRLPRVLGYAEMARLASGELDREAAARAIEAKTFRYAKRQVLWLRSEPGVVWVPADHAAADIGTDIEDAFGAARRGSGVI